MLVKGRVSLTPKTPKAMLFHQAMQAKPNRTDSWKVHIVPLPYIFLIIQSNMKRHTMFQEVKVVNVSVSISMRRNVNTKPNIKPKITGLSETANV